MVRKRRPRGKLLRKNDLYSERKHPSDDFRCEDIHPGNDPLWKRILYLVIISAVLVLVGLLAFNFLNSY